MGYTFKRTKSAPALIQKKKVFYSVEEALEDGEIVDEWIKSGGRDPRSFEPWLRERGYLAAGAKAADVSLGKLRRFLDGKEPGIALLFMRLWADQEKNATYKRIIEAIERGEVGDDIASEWLRDIERLTTDHMQSAWEDAMRTAADDLRRIPGLSFNTAADGVEAWTRMHSADFVVEITRTQMEGLRELVRRAAHMNELSVDELAKAIRPTIGLYRGQAIANMNYYMRLLSDGMKPQRAAELARRYAAEQRKYRAYMIARTELAQAYNQGQYEWVKQAQDAGKMGKCTKTWCTADDERVCDICGALEGVSIAFEDDWDINPRLSPSVSPTIRKMPPAHPHCRCAVLIDEVEPPSSLPSAHFTTTAYFER